MRVELEEAGIKDISEINRIQKLAFKESYEKYGFCPAYEAADEHLKAYLEWARIYKIVSDKKIIGSVFIYKADHNHYEIDSISIDPDFQNSGIGSIAVTQVEELYPDALIWTLATPDTDRRNRHFYEKLGFTAYDSEVINENLKLTRYKKEAGPSIPKRLQY